MLADSIEQLTINRLFPEIALDEFDVRQRIHGKNINRDDAPSTLESTCQVLAPAARCRAEVDADHIGPEQPLPADNLFEFVDRTRTPTLFSGLLHKRIALLPLTPAATSATRFAHEQALKALGRTIDALLHSGPMKLSEPQKKYLRGLGHALKPLIIVGEAGLSDSLIAEYESTLNHHELIKIRVRVGDRRERDDIIEKLCSISSASLIQRIGNVALLYRPNLKKKVDKRIRLPSR